jgi:hypothetical protein
MAKGGVPAAGEAIMHMASVERALEWQADHAHRNGAPCTARLIRALLPLLDTDLAIGRRMRDWPGLSLEDAMPLRLAGGFHYLLLSGADARLAPIYSGAVSDQTAVDAIVETVARDHDERLLGWFESPPQTNEAGRSAGVVAQLLWLSTKFGPRFELYEIGCSAGINTMLDRFHFDLGGIGLGAADSPIRIAPEWRGPPPPCEPVDIVAIAGCDTAPIDLRDPAQALRLKSYVWPEVAGRIERMDAAIAMALGRPPSTERCDAEEFVTAMLARQPRDGVTRVLFHTVVWQYLPAPARAAIEQAMVGAGAGATEQRPLAWVTVETNRETFRHELRCRYWPGGGEEVLLGEAHAHGAWIEWFGVKSPREIPSLRR